MPIVRFMYILGKSTKSCQTIKEANSKYVMDMGDITCISFSIDTFYTRFLV